MTDMLVHSKEDPRIGAQLAAFAIDTKTADIPAEVWDSWRLHTVDTLACAAAGVSLPVAQRVRDLALESGNPSGGAPVIGSSRHTSPMLAAMANAFAANALDYDDGFEHQGKGMGHPGASLVSAAIAALAQGPISGEEFLTAIVVGAEINNRLILSVQPSADRFHEVYGIGQHQSIGAAVTYGRLIGLNAAELENALGLAASLTAVPSLHKYNWENRPIISLKDFVAPAAQAGVQGVNLACAGLIGPQGMFDGPQGFWRMVGSDKFESDILVEGLGQEWLAGEGAFKLYPACRWIAPVLEAFEEVIGESGAGIDEIESVRVLSFADVSQKMSIARPGNAIDAQFSLPHLLACIARGLPPGLPWFSDEVLKDGSGARLAERMVIETDAEMNAAMRGKGRRPSARVELRLLDGREFSNYVSAPLGSKLRPAKDERVLKKFEDLLGQAGNTDPEILSQMLLALPEADNVAEALAPLFSGS